MRLQMGVAELALFPLRGAARLRLTASEIKKPAVTAGFFLGVFTLDRIR
jgi:hypothetical protein